MFNKTDALYREGRFEELLAMRAMSQAELQQQAIAQSAAMQQYVPPLSYYNAMRNYRSHVSIPDAGVPDGWADWYACGDQLH